MDNPPSAEVQMMGLLAKLAEDVLRQVEWTALLRSNPNATTEEAHVAHKRGIDKARQLVVDIGKPFLPIDGKNLDDFAMDLTLEVLRQANQSLPVDD